MIKLTSNICEKCGFDKTLPRELVFLKNDIIAFAVWGSGRCSECDHQEEGWTIIGDNPIGKLNAHWKGNVRKIHKNYQERIASLEKELASSKKLADDNYETAKKNILEKAELEKHKCPGHALTLSEEQLLIAKLTLELKTARADIERLTLLWNRK